MKTNQKTIQVNTIANIAIALLAILLLVYTGYRAAILSFINDESASYNMSVYLKFIEIINFTIPVTTNHMINSIFLKAISLLFGSSEFLLRIPSLLSHVIYIIFTYLLCRKNLTSLFALGGFVVLNTNPYMLDFFSLARGYAMAVAFTVVSVYYLLNYIENNKNSDAIISLSCAAFTVLCNFSLLIYFVPLIATINIYWIAKNKKFNLFILLKKIGIIL
jgi:4-amino-4-deoxy-L-arabinose transferase-like glycosyltransferase